MRSAILQDGVVANVIVGEVPGSIPCPPEVGVGWTYSGGSFSPPAQEPVPLTAELMRVAIQAHLDAAAQSRQYDNSFTLASYVSSTHPEWAAEAAAFIAWRDAVWLHALVELQRVQNGDRPIPTLGGFLEELPLIEWPD